jgi:uncharacterized protein
MADDADAVYTTAVRPEALAAIDVHVHAHPPRGDAGEDAVREASERYFGAGPDSASLDETAEHYRQRRIACVIFGADNASARGRRGVPNEAVLAAAARNNDIMIPFATIDPLRGDAAVRDAEALIARGVRGFKLHPPVHGYFSNDPVCYPLYEVIEAARLPALFHTGQNGIGAGTPGGSGIRLKYGDPLPLDDVAADFPAMPIIMAHPSFPWQDVALSIAVHKQQVHIDLSGWSPKYFPPQLVHYANTLLKDKILFGSDYPLLKPDRWMADFEEAGFRDAVRPGIVKGNAARLLGLA